MAHRLLIGLSSILFLAGSATGDALNILESARQEAEETTVKAAEADDSRGFYVRTEIGANIMQNLNRKGASDSYSLNAGIDFGASIGYQITESLGFEVQSGIAWNSFKRWNEGNRSNNASGSLVQVPIVANVVLTLPLSKGNYEPLFGRDADLKFYFGGGGNYLDGDMSSSGVQQFNIKDWSYRYQAGTVLQAYLAPKTKFGVYFRFSGTGDLAGENPAGAAFDIGPALNYAVGINVSINF